MSEMTWQGWLVLAVTGLVLVLLGFTSMGPDVVLIGGVVLLILAGVLEPKEALAGMANEGMITVGVLFVVGAAIIETGAITMLSERMFGRPKHAGNAIVRMMGPIALLSAFMNNTPLVAMMIPAVGDWAKKHRIAVSKLMLPLSYAAILGGVCTLIGTSTNLVVNGLLIKEYDKQVAQLEKEGSDAKPAFPRGLGMFDIAWVGVPCTLLGCAFIALTHRWLLPHRQPAMEQLADPRQYTVEVMVLPDGPLVGKSIEQAGLRHLQGVFLAEIDREGVIMAAVSPEERLRANDRLIFVGVVDSVVDLHKIRGLMPATEQVFKLSAPRSQRCLIEAVVSTTCPLVGKTVRDGRFRSNYNAVVVAVCREGERIQKKIGDIVLRAGDALLVEAHPSFADLHRHSRDFYLVSRVENSNPPRHDKAYLALAILLAMVAIVTFRETFSDVAKGLGLEKVSMLLASMVASGLLLVTRCVTASQARSAVDWPTLLAIAASFGLGEALEKTGAADVIGGEIVALARGTPWLTLAGIYFITLVVTELVTNNAAAALMFPFAISTATSMQLNPVPFLIAVMVAASCGFATPIGYQTNLMVYGPGGYRFSDYVRLGVPLDILCGIVTVAVAPLVFPF